ncbi:hypothetical protein [Haloechinothrix sp. LS1_15]|uniref:hypothetical protein n=1 Tax=Haloechinothrix sp. LS1_15 TaxID=2652248 RepID=UPI002944CB11|nr:hypothetical protein [Haloechinothrix sp. LS1_15]MDV6011279.1 hypothetical protein [Haloechinothrix sp. LS1_15]
MTSRSTRPTGLGPGLPDDPARATVDRLLAAPEQHGLASRELRGSGVAVVRGFDRDSREFRTMIATAVREHGWWVTDLAAAPSFGAIPDSGDIRLVVAARASVLPLARRCAAHWQATLLDPSGDGGDGGGHEPALVVDVAYAASDTEPEQPAGYRTTARDAVATRLAISGPVSYRIGAATAGTADTLAVEPVANGSLVETGTDGLGTNLRIATGEVTVELDTATEATLDGHPQLLPDGQYTVSLHAHAYRRLEPEVPVIPAR